MVVIVKDAEDLETRLKEAGDALVIIDFFATWCGPCKMIAPEFEDLTKKYPNIVLLKVDVDENEDIAANYDVTSMPTFIFIKAGKKVHQFAGASLPKLTEAIEKHQ